MFTFNHASNIFKFIIILWCYELMDEQLLKLSNHFNLIGSNLVLIDSLVVGLTSIRTTHIRWFFLQYLQVFA